MVIRDALNTIMFKVDSKELYAMGTGSKRVGIINMIWSHVKDYFYPIQVCVQEKESVSWTISSSL
jgi:hypothetical protein